MKLIQKIALLKLFVFTTLVISAQNCPQGPIQANNGQGGGSCNSNDSPPSGNPNWTKSGEWTFNSGPNTDLSIYTVYKDGSLYQSGNNAPSGSGTIWFGGYKASTKTLCFYSQSQNINTPASGNWQITFSSSNGAQCTYNVSSGGGVTLPVTWETLSAQKQNSQVLIYWSTASEQNTKDFEVQYSTNTTNWDLLGTIQAAGNSNSTRNYSFTHQTPLKNNTYNYYRILQRDIDGKFSYSKIVSIIFNEPGPDMSVYPNPVSDVLTVYLSESKLVRLSNAAGAIVWQSNLPAGRNQISVSQYSKGVYVLTAGLQSYRVIIQ
jgi:Secretion system C-terminal sorting domain